MWKLIKEPDVKYFQFIFKNRLFLYSTKWGTEKFLERFVPVMLNQIHSDIIIDIDKENNMVGDGLITSLNKAIGVKVADCLPVYLFNDEKIAVLHCGWRSIMGGIVKKVKVILQDYQYCLGAAIGPCCYEVKSDVVLPFSQKYPEAVVERGNRIFLNLKKAVIQELGADRCLANLDFCTLCNEEYFYSHRRGDKKRNYAVLTSVR